MVDSEDSDDAAVSDSDEGPYCSTCKKCPGADKFEPGFKTCRPCRNKFRRRSAGSQSSAASAAAHVMVSQMSERDEEDADESNADDTAESEMDLGPYCSTRDHYPGADQFRDGLKTCFPCLERRRNDKKRAEGRLRGGESLDPISHVLQDSPAPVKHSSAEHRAVVVSPQVRHCFLLPFTSTRVSRPIFFYCM